MRLLTRAVEAKDWEISKDLMRFLRSVDEDGTVLRQVLEQVGIEVEPSLERISEIE